MNSRLSSWKEIAAHFRVSVRTVQRWEKEEGLPVSRHPHSRLSSVFAERSQLDEWFAGRTAVSARNPQEPLSSVEAVANCSIAVLPFENPDGDPETEILADGLTGELIEALQRTPGLHVVAHASSFSLKNHPLPLRLYSTSLGARFALAGSIQKSVRGLQVSAYLTHTTEGVHHWSHRMDRPVADLPAIPREIVYAVTGKLRIHQSPSAAMSPLSSRAPNDFEIYRLYFKGQHFLRGRRSRGLQTAIECFTRLLAMDPTFAAAWARLADCHLRMANFALAPVVHSAELARQAARKAVEFDRSLAEAHATLAFLAAALDYDWASSERQFQLALRLRPEVPEIHGIFAGILLSQGRFDETELEIAAVRHTDPLNPFIGNTAGFLAICRRQYQRAAAAFREILQREPDQPYALYWMAETHLLEGRFDEAAAFASSTGMPSFGAGLQAFAYCKLGRLAEAISIRTGMESLEPPPALQIALACLAIGDLDKTFYWLERAIELRSLGIHWIKVDPLWDQARPDPRFRALLDRIRLTE